MEERLRSISRKIHWSLAFKALIITVAWVILPEWIAWVLGAFFYFSSLFRARHMGLPMLAAFVLAHFLGTGIWSAILLGAAFYLVLGLKKLLFIDRSLVSMEVLFLEIFMAGILLYDNMSTWTAWVPIQTLLFAWFFWALARGVLDQKEESHPRYPLALGVMSFLLWEIATVLAYLPIDFLYQAIIAIFTAYIFFEWLVAYTEQSISKNKILLYVSFMFILITLIFSFVQWSV